MTVRIFHTADLHLGMKFAHGYPPHIQEKLARARYDTLRHMITLANEEKCQIFLVAGDLFDSHQIAAKYMQTVIETLNKFEGSMVVIMPGNHDYISSSSDFWTKFSSKAGPSVILLEKPIPYDFRRYDIKLAFYPAPCMSRHSEENAIGWVRGFPKVPGVICHIGIAHGSVKGISPDFNEEYYPMTQKELQASGIDLWLMGHTHIRYPNVEEGRDNIILFPATPEPDGFDCNHLGYAWIIDVGNDNSFRYRSIKTGKHRFLNLNVDMSGENDLNKLGSQFKKLKSDSSLVQLRLIGSLPSDAFERLNTLEQELEKNVLYLKIDKYGLHKAFTTKDIDREFTKGSFPHHLLKELVGESADPLAVQMAYDLIKKARQ